MSGDNSNLDRKIFGGKKLPEMLNVITIITIGYSSMLFISGIVNLFVLPSMLEKFNDEVNIHEIDFSEIGNPFIEQIAKAGIGVIEYLPALTLINILVAAICVLGAILMRKLNKKGYFLYVLGVAIEIIIPIIIIGSKIIGSLIVLGSIFSIVFVILYSVNLKHMK